MAADVSQVPLTVKPRAAQILRRVSYYISTRPRHSHNSTGTMIVFPPTSKVSARANIEVTAISRTRVQKSFFMCLAGVEKRDSQNTAAPAGWRSRQPVSCVASWSALINDSAGMPSPLCKRQIILRLSGRLRFNTSYTRLRLPI